MNEIPNHILNQLGTGNSPFGDLTPSARQRQAISHESSTLCANLLAKATVAVDRDDQEAADRYLRRAHEDRSVDVDRRFEIAREVVVLCTAFVHTADDAGIAPH